METIAKKKLEKFINRYNEYKEQLKDESEQTMRTWIDEFLSIFDWDCKNPMQVRQEKMITKAERERLKLIGSIHSKPDYTLKNGKVRLNFLDAKDLHDNIKESKDIAFQARSYGWSAGLECSIVTNVEEIAFYSCYSIPSKDDSVELERVYLKVDQYLDNFDILFKLLYRSNVFQGEQSKILNKELCDKKVKKIDLDSSFSNLLTNFRLDLAKDIYIHNKDIIKDNNILINNIVQSIINRIMFIRICEGRGLEEKEILIKMLSGGFWSNFKEKSKSTYEMDYDGPIFNHLDILDEIQIPDNYFIRFITSLYEPTPYKFDVIPTELMASMYEKFLSTEIYIDDGKVMQREKEFYIKQQGAISTPEYMVDFLLEQTFEGLKDVNSLDELLQLKILEPACGSGTFLIGILDYLQKRALELYKNNKIQKDEKSLFLEIDNNIFPTAELKRRIITKCLYAIDMDHQAVEVAKISIALKLIDNYQLPFYNEQFGLTKKLLLKDIGKNIIHGNTLVGSDIIEQFPSIQPEHLRMIVPLDIKSDKSMEIVFKNKEIDKNGFDFIVGNPPYVETKRYIDSLPYCREYFKNNYDFDDHKADMSIYFIEKCIKLLNSKGKLSFLCQKRFFKTEYGEKTRKCIATNNYINKIVDFKSQDIFKDRITYIALLMFSKSKKDIEEFDYLSLSEEPEALKNILTKVEKQNYIEKSTDILNEKTWNLTENDELENLVSNIVNKFDTLAELKNIGLCNIHGGIQVLRNDVYYINNAKIDRKRRIITGVNRRTQKDARKEVCVELDICRPIIANRDLQKFQSLTPSYYAIIPYTLDTTTPINFDDLQSQYPLCYEYLLGQELYVKSKNKEIYDGNRWHLFTRTTNLNKFNSKKIMFPMTTKEVVASYTNQPSYPDNSNMWFLVFRDEDDDFHLAITAILNSRLFSVMAIYYSNPQANGYRKMNKQFVLPVAIPYKKLKEDIKLIKCLKQYSIDINRLLTSFDSAVTDGGKRSLLMSINSKFNDLNIYVNKIYELNSQEEEIVDRMYKIYMKS